MNFLVALICFTAVVLYLANYMLLREFILKAINQSEQTKLLREINAKLDNDKTKIDS